MTGHADLAEHLAQDDHHAEVLYSATNCTYGHLPGGIPCLQHFDSVRIAAHTAVFQHDSLGNLTLAANRDARVLRRYHRNSLARTDTLRLRKCATSSGGGGGGGHEPESRGLRVAGRAQLSAPVQRLGLHSRLRAALPIPSRFPPCRLTQLSRRRHFEFTLTSTGLSPPQALS